MNPTKPSSKLAGLTPELVVLTPAGDMCRWDGGQHIDVFEQAAHWQAGDDPTTSIAVPKDKPFTVGQFLELIDAGVLVWEPDDDGFEYASSRKRRRPDMTAARYRLAPTGIGYTLALLHYNGDEIADREVLSAYTSRMLAIEDAQHWETARHLGYDCVTCT